MKSGFAAVVIGQVGSGTHRFSHDAPDVRQGGVGLPKDRNCLLPALISSEKEFSNSHCGLGKRTHTDTVEDV